MTESASRILFLFPGQGSQYPGIGTDLLANFAAARSTYEFASEALGYDMAELSSAESGEKIHLTRYTQPALVTHSIACMRVFQEQAANRIAPEYACGHSLGEYSALVAANALEFEAALRLVSRRGELMGQYGTGEMLAVPVSADLLMPLLRKNYCALAAVNLPEQSVCGGLGEDLDRLISDFESDYPAKPCVRLKTEGAFHTHYMVSAALAYREVLNEARIREPECAVASNYTGTFHPSNAADIRSSLYFQLFNPVLWNQNLMQVAAQGVDTVIEFGGGLGAGTDPALKRPNLAGMIMRAYRRVTPRPAYHPVINMKSLESALQAIGSAG